MTPHDTTGRAAGPARAAATVARRLASGAAALAAGLLLAACGTTAEPTAEVVPDAAALRGTLWTLDELAGAAVLDSVESTLGFPALDRIAGQLGCNRYVAPLDWRSDGRVRLRGELASTRMACAPEVMAQEQRYAQALARAERLAFDGPDLLLYSSGLAQPLRFKRSPH